MIYQIRNYAARKKFFSIIIFQFYFHQISSEVFFINNFLRLFENHLQIYTNTIPILFYKDAQYPKQYPKISQKVAPYNLYSKYHKIISSSDFVDGIQI